MIAKGGDRLLETASRGGAEGRTAAARAHRHAQHPGGGGAGRDADPLARRHARGGRPDPATGAARRTGEGRARRRQRVHRRRRARRREVSRSAGRACRAGTRTAPAARCRRRSPRTWRREWTTRLRSAPRGNTWRAPSATRRRSVAVTGRSIMSGSVKQAGILTRWRERLLPHHQKLPAGRPPFRVTLEPLDPAQTAQAVTSPDCGAVATFVGLVRDHNAGRRFAALDYECYEPLAVKSLRADCRRSGGRNGRARAWRSPTGSGRLADRRRQRRDRRRLAAPRRRVCRMPLRDRARQADRPDLEARALRGRRSLDRGRHGGSGRRGGEADALERARQ